MSEPRERAWLSFALLAANLGCFALAVALSGAARVMQLDMRVLIGLGANVAPFTQYAGHWENLVTSTFLHAGAVHVLFNLVALFQVGPFVERTVGRARFSIMYLVSGIGASCATMFASNLGWSRTGVAVGASGAICGLIGGAAVLGFRIEGRRSPLALSMLRWLGFTVIFGYVVSLGGGVSIDNNAHLGGALVGGLVALSFRRSVSYSALGRAVRVLGCALFVVAAFAVKLARPEPAWTHAKLRCLLGDQDATRADLRELGVSSKNTQEIISHCSRSP